MGFPADQLHVQEEIVLDLHPHWWFFWRPTAAVLGAVAFGVITLALQSIPPQVGYLAGFLILLAVGWFGIQYVVWSSTNFVITTDRLISRSGVLNRQGVEIPLERINTVFFAQSIFERLIGSGDLRIESAGEMGTSEFHDIRRPLDVQNEIYRQMEGNENRKFDRVAQGMLAAQGVSARQPTIAEQIEQLDQLRVKGLITNEEFETKKTELLRRM